MGRKPQFSKEMTRPNEVLRVIVETWDGRYYELYQHQIWNVFPVFLLHNQHGGGVVFWNERDMLEVAESKAVEGVWQGKGTASGLKKLFQQMIDKGLLKPLEGEP